MDKNEAIKIATRYTSLINKKYPLERAILFGSFAKGTHHPDSDIDVALIFRSLDNVFAMQIELMCLRTDDDLLIEPHPFAVADFKTSHPMIEEIIKNGIELKNFAA